MAAEIVVDVENGLQVASRFDGDLKQAEDGLVWIQNCINEDRHEIIEEELRCVYRKLRDIAGDITKYTTEEYEYDMLKTRVLQYSNVGSQFIMLISRVRENYNQYDAHDLAQMHKDVAVYIDTLQNIITNISEMRENSLNVVDITPNSNNSNNNDDASTPRSVSQPSDDARAKRMRRYRRIGIAAAIVVILIIVGAIVLSEILKNL